MLFLISSEPEIEYEYVWATEYMMVVNYSICVMDKEDEQYN